MFQLECIHEAPDRRVGAFDDTFEAVVPGGLHVSSEGRHVSWNKRLDVSPRHVDIIRRYEG